MLGLKSMAFAAIAGFACLTTTQTQAQINISIGAPPACPYGYYDYEPYSCAPVGYYGPEWFNGGVFIGAGRWFHGPSNFHGTVNNRFDPQHGYKGALPRANDRPDPAKRVDSAHFKGNESRDGRGHVVGGKR